MEKYNDLINVVLWYLIALELGAIAPERTDMQKSFSIALPLWILVALVGVIGLGHFFLKDEPVATPKVRQEVVKVIGRYTEVFDGVGASIGFLVQSNNGLEVINCDTGFMTASPGWKPEYLTVVHWTNGKTTVMPATVDRFN
ncbi:MAG: hypothetical protein U0522_03130 [Candidatus Paceibacterota bacterium]